MTRGSRKQERGTVAVVVAISATMIFALCALGVDLGSAYARKRDIQTQADLAVLAAGAHLPTSSLTKAAIEKAATDYALTNEVAGQDSAGWDFSDSDKTNGYIEYVNSNKIRLFAPQSNVDFWLAPAAGLSDGIAVSAVAAAEVRSPGVSLPFYISTTCSWGSQTILDPAPGKDPDADYVPNLVPVSSPESSIKIASVGTSSFPKLAPTPLPTLTVNAESNNGFNNVDIASPNKPVMFSNEDGVTYYAAAKSKTGDQITVEVPADVFGADNYWFVRLIDKNGKYTTEETAPWFKVGDPLTPYGKCVGSESGNFGSLNLSRNDTSSGKYLEENMAQGIQHQLTRWEGGVYPDNCALDVNAVMDDGEPDPARALNCLKTDTGADLANKATNAFIRGTTGQPTGRLNVPTTVRNIGGSGLGCSPTKTAARRPVTTSGNPKDWQINDDVLSCFFEDDSTTTVGAVSSEAYSGPRVISEDIFDSPRFFWLPVLVRDPTGGTSGNYAIVDLRPAFITEQDPAGTRSVPLATTNNGVEMDSNGIAKIRIVTLNPKALPDYATTPGGGTIPYLGGTKVVTLVE